ncbi:MAG TPA: hypothetical protein VFR84_12245 [Candidatus Angelobacter sp.]|nr:hypothetical protein [Candidatus Angelobacter sp.]
MRLSHFFLLPLLSSAAFPQNQITDPGAKQICAAVKDAAPPSEDRPRPAEEKSLARCASLDAYFGFGQPVDPVKARKCAFAELDRDAKVVLGGKAILMMVYANGKGAQRNFDVALNFACTIGDAPGDAAGRVHQLDRLKKMNWAGGNFSVCDHSSGRELYEQCAILSERFDAIERDRKFNELIEKWTPRQQKAFHTFMQEADRFFKVQVRNGINLESTFEVQEEGFLRNNLLSSLQQFESGQLPKASKDDFKRAEADERAAYEHTQNGPVARWGTVTRESLHLSEVEWRRYVNEWIDFARQRYPETSEQDWKTWLDQERLVALNRFAQ